MGQDGAQGPAPGQAHEAVEVRDIDRTLVRVHLPVRELRAEVARDVAGWLTTNDVADRVRKKPRTVLGWMHAGKIKAAGQLPDGTFLFDARDVLAFVRFGIASADAAPDARPRRRAV